MPNFNKLHGKRIVIIGGTSGIGFAVAEASIVAGASVTISSSNAARVDNALERLRATAKGAVEVAGKVLDIKGGEDAVKAFFDGLGEFDHLVWTAGDKIRTGSLDTVDLTNAPDTFTVRTLGPLYAAKHARSHMPVSATSSFTLSAGGVVRKPAAGWSLVAAIAGGATSLTRGLAIDMAPIRVNVVAPGLTDTEMWDPIMGDNRKAFIAGAPTGLVKHVADADEISEAYLYAMKCAYVTGETIFADGGAALA